MYVKKMTIYHDVMCGTASGSPWSNCCPGDPGSDKRQKMKQNETRQLTSRVAGRNQDGAQVDIHKP